MLDSETELPITSKDIVKYVDWAIDKSEKYDLSGVSTIPIESISVACNLPIIFSSSFTLCEDFFCHSVVVTIDGTQTKFFNLTHFLMFQIKIQKVL